MPVASAADWVAINRLFVRYAWALDHGDVDGVVACFTPDAIVESPVMGRYEGAARIRDFAERNARLWRAGVRMRHVIANVEADVDGDRADARCYLVNYITRDGRSELVAPGSYECRLARAGDDWRFTYRLVTLDRPAVIEGR